MEDCRVIPVGHKLRLLRKRYNLRQEEIVGDDVTRNLISQIENGKAKLTRSTAQIIMSHVTEILEKNNLTLDIDIEYLLEDQEAQARKILDQFIDELKELLDNNDTSFINTLKDADQFLLEWDFIDKKILICELAGDYFSGNNDFYKASVYYENVKCLMNLNMDVASLIPVLKKLSKVYFCMEKYKDGIDVCNYALDRFPQMNDDYKVVFLFNSSLYYNYSKEYKKSLDIIDKLKNIVNENTKDKHGDIYIRILLLQASSLQFLKCYDEALKIYNIALEITSKENCGYISIYCNNICEIYIDMGKIEEANERINFILNNLKNIPNDFIMLPQLYLEISRRYIELKDYDNAVTYLRKTLNLAKAFKYSFVINDVIMELIHMSHKDLAVNIKDEFIELVTNVGSVNNMLMLNVLQYFTKLNDAKSVIEICEFCKKYSENTYKGRD
ncbi:helix-turn-helix transcriptional regulator [Clostridium sp. 19966]|uniref:helix-turn-helix domain-containing protein n=1 Tax=Clostridium sp. 19966 TaxID=2768166 RepID=UPI0028DEADA8|nr:helix-turn-helix transcriptional regulator [Clostridium sp. 19966]MDT8717924.1 helix-turn-helix transcriptional regulator [Clostridium sp. 19966]